jgi:hypothetical protein
MDRARIGLVGRRHRSAREWRVLGRRHRLVFMVVPPDPPGHANALWYVRENAYVIATLVLFALIAALL